MHASQYVAYVNSFGCMQRLLFHSSRDHKLFLNFKLNKLDIKNWFKLFAIVLCICKQFTVANKANATDTMQMPSFLGLYSLYRTKKNISRNGRTNRSRRWCWIQILYRLYIFSIKIIARSLDFKITLGCFPFEDLLNLGRT